MNRRDMIIVAVLLNAAIIAVLLIMAVNTDEETPYEHTSVTAAEPIKEKPESPIEQPPEKLTSNRNTGVPIVIDLEAVGFDNMLDYNNNSDDVFLSDDEMSVVYDRSAVSNHVEDENKPYTEADMTGVKIVDVAVKKGDSLDKIARANATSIEAIKRLNQLKNEKLSIGQMLKVPVGFKKPAAAITPQTQVKAAPVSDNRPQAPQEAVYYTIKSGDNPWKIAKQLRIDMEDLLRLNHLNEEKARNLKPGDKIRIR